MPTINFLNFISSWILKKVKIEKCQAFFKISFLIFFFCNSLNLLSQVENIEDFKRLHLINKKLKKITIEERRIMQLRRLKDISTPTAVEEVFKI